MFGTCAGGNESLCISNTKLTGTTTVIAKPGQGVALRNMIATMPGALEPHNQGTQLCFGFCISRMGSAA